MRLRKVHRQSCGRNVIDIDSDESRQDCPGKGYSVSVVDEAGTEIHRESIDRAETSGS
jgi:hypothetical protein